MQGGFVGGGPLQLHQIPEAPAFTALGLQVASLQRRLTGPQILFGAAPDERYISAGLGILGVWSSLENLAYPN